MEEIKIYEVVNRDHWSEDRFEDNSLGFYSTKQKAEDIMHGFQLRDAACDLPPSEYLVIEHILDAQYDLIIDSVKEAIDEYLAKH